MQPPPLKQVHMGTAFDFKSSAQGSQETINSKGLRREVSGNSESLYTSGNY